MFGVFLVGSLVVRFLSVFLLFFVSFGLGFCVVSFSVSNTNK